MRGSEQLLERGARVRQFNRTHPSTDPEHATVLGRFDEQLDRAQLIAERQRVALAAAKSARTTRAELRQVIHTQLLPYLVTIGGIAAETVTSLAARFRLPDSHGSHQAFLASAREMLALANENKDAMVKEGMSPRVLDELTAKVAEFAEICDAARAAKLAHIGARATLGQALRGVAKQVKALDAINRWRFGTDPDLLVEWKAAKRINHRSNGRGDNGNGAAPPTGEPAPTQ